MKAVLFAPLFAAAAAADAGADPIGQVIMMCEDLMAKVTADGEADQKAYDEYFSWCDDTATEKQQELKAANSQKGKLEASIDELASEVEVCDTNIADLVKAISENGKDLSAATKIRKEEEGVFSKNDGELEDVVATLGKAVGVLEKELASGSASFAQLSNSPPCRNCFRDSALSSMPLRSLCPTRTSCRHSSNPTRSPRMTTARPRALRRRAEASSKSLAT